MENGTPAQTEHAGVHLCLPVYAPILDAYHQAFAPELQAMIIHLPLAPDHRVLDVACGDGIYACWIAAHIAPSGHVVGTDLSLDYLTLAQQRACPSSGAFNVSFVAGNAERLPFADDSFDFAWCAQSLYSLPQPISVLQEMRRVVRPEGIVAVLESDTLHHVLLPWPVKLELAIRQAELQAFAEETTAPKKFYMGRRLPRIFHAAQLEHSRLDIYAHTRHAPLCSAERTFAEFYLQDLQQRIRPYLEATTLQRLESLITPGSAAYLLDRPDLTIPCLDYVIWGMKS